MIDKLAYCKLNARSVSVDNLHSNANTLNNIQKIKNMKPKIFIIILSLIVLGSCRTWDEDFNVDHNKPQLSSGNPIPPEFFLGAMLNEVTNPFGSAYPLPMLNVIAPTAGYTGKTRSLSQANRHRSWHDLDGDIWGPTFNTIQKVKNMRRAAIGSGDDRYHAVADIWQSYVLYTMTSLDGPIPYFDVIADGDEFSYLIKYDKQDEIFIDILDKLKKAGLMIKSTDANINAEADYIYAGDIQKWKKLSNMLRLRAALQMYNAAPNEAKSVINEILADPQTYPIFESNDDNFAVHYDGSIRVSPWFVNGSRNLLSQHIVSNIVVERLVSLKDPRLPVYAKPVQKIHTNPDLYVLPNNPGPKKYVGHLFGITTSNGDAANWNGGLEYGSRIGDWFLSVDENMNITDECGKFPLVLGTYSELNFSLAEMAKRGIISGGDAAAHQYYRKGIQASMDYYQCKFKGDALYDGAFGDEGLDSFDAYLSQPHVNWTGGRDHLLLIAEQKWISNYMLGFEPYFEHRRTMLPGLPSSHLAGGYESSGSGTKFPSRTDYPVSESAENPDAVNEAYATGFDIPITGAENRNDAKMWIINNAASPSLQMPIFQEPENKKNEYPGGANFKAWYDAHWETMFWWVNE